MDNIKKFIKEERQYNLSYNSQDKSEGYSIKLNDLGLFFWKRGGKQFVLNHLKNCRDVENLIASAKETVELKDWEEFITLEIILWARDFLDCLACLGRRKVKKLIEKAKEN